MVDEKLVPLALEPDLMFTFLHESLNIDDILTECLEDPLFENIVEQSPSLFIIDLARRKKRRKYSWPCDIPRRVFVGMIGDFKIYPPDQYVFIPLSMYSEFEKESHIETVKFINTMVWRYLNALFKGCLF